LPIQSGIPPLRHSAHLMSLKLKIILLKVPICITIGWLFNSVHSTVKSILKNDTEDIKGKLGIRLYRNGIDKQFIIEQNCIFTLKISFLVLSSFVSLITSYYWNKISTRSVLILVLFLSSGWNHMHSGYASGYASAPGVARGYASGHKKICIFPQATPQAFYCTIFALRDGLCKFFMPSGYASGIFPKN
ncbi:hypothetical protein T03_5672, partial [Trichinella britovi]